MLEQPGFGRRLKSLRLERGLSQSELADGGLSTGYLSRLESGARKPTNQIVDHLAKRLGVPASTFETAPAPSSLAQCVAAVISAVPGDDRAEALADALHADKTRDVALRWQALWLLSRMRGTQGRHKEELALLTELGPLSDELGSAELRARVYTQLSRCARALGHNAKAREYAVQAYALADRLSVTDRAGVLQALVSAEAEAGLLTEARTHADELCELTEHETSTLRIEALWVAATVRIRQGDYSAALTVLERALQGLTGSADLMLWTRLRLAAASLYLQITPPLVEQARARLDEVEPLLGLVGTDLHKQQLLALRAQLAFEDGRTDDARALCEQVDETVLLLSFRDRVRFQMLRNRLLILDGRFDAGVRGLQELAQEAQDALHVELAAEIWRSLAKTLADAYAKPGGKQPRRSARAASR
jgi:transcriptional regulator with XRE-family HTH domain